MRLIRHSLRARLVLAASGSIVAAVALFGLTTVLIVRHELRGSLDSALRQRALHVSELAVSAPAVLTAPGALESPVSGRQIVVEVLDSRGRILARSLALGAYLLPEDQLTFRAIDHGATGYEDVQVDGSPYRLYAAPIAQASGAASGGAVLVASDTSDISHTIGHLAAVVALTGAGVALVAILAAVLLTGRGLRALRRLAAAGEEIEQTADPSRRLPETDSSDEIGQLTGVLNRMLAALCDARESERRFLADASHELRTPVTTMRGNVEYIARHGATPEVIVDLEHDAERLARLVDDLLVLERANAEAQQPRPVELTTVITRVLSEHQRDARLRRGAVEPVVVTGDAHELGRALDNLIENAFVHGPADGTVTVSLRREDGRALLSVSDQGKGPPPDQHEQLFERFWRGPDAGGSPGSGLGLAIVAAIATRHHGRVSVDASTFTIELPAAP
ncbi:MAG: sensor histidine kinase [Solirubrobacteraceae bacterium]